MPIIYIVFFFQIALILLGLTALSAADYNLRMRPSVPVKAYGQPVAEVEEVMEEPVQYKAAVKSVVKTPIRVVSEPVMSTYAATGYSSTRQEKEQNERVAEEQSKNAKYSFGSAIDDGIMDHSHVRQESREGGKVSFELFYPRVIIT